MPWYNADTIQKVSRVKEQTIIFSIQTTGVLV